ncbi:Putative uncharacterized protein [Lactococcus lactis subsp. lactis A12]|uniref:Uncharacterized protein n=1 Tax=Lactococcus lactis subsp. lactis A12 TaxID=1137134 RepID=S6FL99_LACLL|nr:Putative uncharacterized protein [Lactococcus lactis subsp. lactis A12]
MEKENFQI